MLVSLLGYRQVTCTHNKQGTVHALWAWTFLLLVLMRWKLAVFKGERTRALKLNIQKVLNGNAWLKLWGVIPRLKSHYRMAIPWTAHSLAFHSCVYICFLFYNFICSTICSKFQWKTNTRVYSAFTYKDNHSKQKNDKTYNIFYHRMAKNSN